MEYVNPGKLFIKKFGQVESGQDVTRFANFLREEAGLNDEPPIDLTKIYERFGIPEPKRASLPNMQGLLLDPDTGMIIVNEDDPYTRQRFTEAHELIELLFSALSSSKGWASRRTEIFAQSAKEHLCNEGAAELLMPQTTFIPRIQAFGVSYQTARRLSLEFDVSVTAALVHMARVGPGNHAVVLWRMKNKPTENQRKISPHQISMFENLLCQSAPQKLRVEWSLSSPKTPYIPTHKSIPDDSAIFKAWLEGVFTTGEDYLDLGNVQGIFRSENNPFNVENERQVLSLLHFPDDRGCAI